MDKKQDPGFGINIPNPQLWQKLFLTNKKRGTFHSINYGKQVFHPDLVAFWAD
jgi:hypothetical protein